MNTRNIWPWLLLAGGYLFMSQHKPLPRGIRNNNPGNIRINAANNWVGKIPVSRNTDKTFEQFDTPENGIRALRVLLRTYATKYGAKSIETIVRRFAPENENDTKRYVATVSAITGIPPWQELYDFNMPSIIAAIIRMENGVQPYTDTQIAEGIRRAQ